MSSWTMTICISTPCRIVPVDQRWSNDCGIVLHHGRSKSMSTGRLTSDFCVSVAACALTLVMFSIAAHAATGAEKTDMTAFARADESVAGAIERRETPGAVLVAGTGDAIVYRKAYGHFSYDDGAPAVALDTMYDL